MSKVSYSVAEVQAMTPSDFRRVVRQNQWPEYTDDCCREPGYYPF